MLSFFPRDALDEIWDLIESVSEGLPTYSYNYQERKKEKKERKVRVNNIKYIKHSDTSIMVYVFTVSVCRPILQVGTLYGDC